MRHARTPLLILLAGFAAATIAVAGSEGKANPRRGKVFYRANCRVCHDGSTDAKELSPITKTMAQWNKDFAEGGAVSKCLPRVKEKTGTDLTAQDLLDMQSYLVEHAADSDQPATCGN